MKQGSTAGEAFSVLPVTYRERWQSVGGTGEIFKLRRWRAFEHAL